MRFVADIMLGRLARWLRVLGFDTRYQSFELTQDVTEMLERARIPLTRRRKLIPSLEGAVFIRYNSIGKQLIQLKKTLPLETCHVNWFSRCLLCNVLLMDAHEEAARDSIPEYVFHQNITSIRFCPVCGRYFWPGSHRDRMEKQLNIWGFTKPFS
jgi:uncharacterized protein